MDYQNLLEGLSVEGSIPAGVATMITQDNRRIEPGGVFVCIRGRTSDGHDFARAALEAGAGLIISEHKLGLKREVVAEDTRHAYAFLCQRFFGNPAEKLTLIAVTGTNGKTTVSSILKQVLQALGRPCGLIGSIHSEIGQMTIPAKYTTPEPWDLAALMHRMVVAGCTHVVMEASSQALDQGRLLGLRFALSIFTNLSRDHLDWHGSMDEYYAAKKSLFAQSDAMLTNMDDLYGGHLLEEAAAPQKCSYSFKSDAADFVAHSVELQAGAVRFGFLGEGMLYPLTFPMPGEYSVYNALAAGGAAIMLGLPAGDVVEALGKVKSVPGRCEVLHAGRFTVIRDFAHTGDGLEKLLGALRPFVKGRLVVLYGCAGERDASKRIEMSESAVRYGDVLFLTSDNPRGEPPDKIIREALPPLEQAGKPYNTFIDREDALRRALDTLGDGDVLTLCGKGHEDYQVLAGRTVFLDEKQFVEEWLESCSAEIDGQQAAVLH
ncbi:UDP-N-acetylmuramoyl-L-alanyl-D-glutamate--2,6-diaminopimelate ligase [Ruminococcaceae bacterium OttesenSCG-928-I18]|nr:UDP-N-acetylmuramoyl-L-alanyl-D-glutamate--2,6-diaminopimelate ligase [Ruminococcaceae bacterium OttesenSCG-928-I18]